MHDILKLSMIRSLKEIGISLEDIKDILKNNTKSMDDSLLLQEQLLDIKINNLKKQKEKVRLMISQRKQHRSEEHTSELQSRGHLVCRLLLEKKKKNRTINIVE